DHRPQTSHRKTSEGKTSDLRPQTSDLRPQTSRTSEQLLGWRNLRYILAHVMVIGLSTAFYIGLRAKDDDLPLRSIQFFCG
ncbi:MAG: hypothetical protein ACYCOU_07960, partial [Sulfobacillus sp.]